MVCIHCGAQTSVNNSRHQKRLNQVWRRRRCEHCGAIFTTHERIDYSQSLVVRTKSNKLTPFQRDKLFLSIYQSCRHRRSPISDAGALTDTVMAVVTPQSDNSTLDAGVIQSAAYMALCRFDEVAAVQYQAFHP